MCEYRGGVVWLILNDFDVATRVGDKGLPVAGNSSRHRTGTLPFMSLDILQNLRTSTHYLRHDLEGVFWVALWCLVKFPRSKNSTEENTRRKALLDWEKGGLTAICNRKLSLLTEGSTLAVIPLTPEMQPHYRSWIMLFAEVLSSAYSTLNTMNRMHITRGLAPWNSHLEKMESAFVPETIDNGVTCEKIREQLLIWEMENPGVKTIKGFVPYQVHNHAPDGGANDKEPYA